MGGVLRRLTGHMVNVAPATPPLTGAVVRLVLHHGGMAHTVSSAKVDSKGGYSIAFRPTESGRYVVESSALPHRLENGSLSPKFFDALQASSRFLGTMVVVGRPTITGHTVSGRILTVRGRLAPTVEHSDGTVTLLVRKPGGARFHPVTSHAVKPGVGTFALSAALSPAGTWSYCIRWAVPGQIRSELTSVHHAAVP